MASYCIRFSSILQELRPICKTRNQFYLILLFSSSWLTYSITSLTLRYAPRKFPPCPSFPGGMLWWCCRTCFSASPRVVILLVSPVCVVLSAAPLTHVPLVLQRCSLSLRMKVSLRDALYASMLARGLLKGDVSLPNIPLVITQASQHAIMRD